MSHTPYTGRKHIIPIDLEVTFDSMFKWSAQATAISDKLQISIKVLKALTASSSLAIDKEALLNLSDIL